MSIVPNNCMDQDAIWYGRRPQPERHWVRWGPSSPSPKRGQGPQFLAHVSCAKRLDGSRCHTWYDGMPRPGRHCVRCGPCFTPRETAPKFRPMSVVAKRVYGFKMLLVAKVGLGPGRLVLHEDQLPLPKGAQPPIFGPCILWPYGRRSQLLLSTYMGLGSGGGIAEQL